MAENIKKKSSRRQNKDEIFLYILGFLFSFLLFVDVLFSTWKTFCVLFSFSCTQQKRERVMSKKNSECARRKEKMLRIDLTFYSFLSVFFSLFFGWKDAKVFVKPFFRKNNFYFFTCCDFTFFSFRILRKFVILGVFFIFRYEFLKNTSIFPRFWLAFSILLFTITFHKYWN